MRSQEIYQSNSDRLPRVACAAGGPVDVRSLEFRFRHSQR